MNFCKRLVVTLYLLCFISLGYATSNNLTTPMAENEIEGITESKLLEILNPLIPSHTLSMIGTSDTDQDIPADYLQESYDNNVCQFKHLKGISIDNKCRKNIHYLNSLLKSLGNKFSLSNSKHHLANPLDVKSIHFQKINYDTLVDLPSGPKVFNKLSAGLFMPNIPAQNVKGLVLYFSGTTLNKTEVGSNISIAKTQLIADIFTSQGYIVAIPDMIGLGDDWRNVHPYVIYPEVSVQTALDLLKSIPNNINTHYATLNKPINLFVTGFSEGGAYALWFNKYVHQHPEKLDEAYSLKHAVGISGAYSVSDVTYGYMMEDVSLLPNHYKIQNQMIVNLTKSALAANTFLSYATYSLNSDFYKLFNPEFFDMKCTGYVNVLGIHQNIPQEKCNVNNTQMDLQSALTAPNYAPVLEIVFSSLNKRGVMNGEEKNSTPNLAQLLISRKNSVIPYTGGQFSNDLSIKETFQTVLAAADLNLQSTPDNSMSIISLRHDSVVSSNNFESIFKQFPSKFLHHVFVNEINIQALSPLSGEHVDKINAKYVPIDHMQFLPYGLTIALGIFENI